MAGIVTPHAKVEAESPMRKPVAQTAAGPRPVPMPPIDIQGRLSNPIAGLKLPDVPLGQAVDLIAAMSTLPISFDPDALQELGVTLRDPVSVELADTTVRQAIEAVVSSRKLTSVVMDSGVLVTAPAAHRGLLGRVQYTVSDLTGASAGAEAELAALLEKLVVPISWRRDGGRGSIETGQGVLIVEQTPAVHYQILVFCEKLRVARGKPTRSRLQPERFTLATRADRARALLEHPVTVHFREPTPLADILSRLKTACGGAILIDSPALAAAGTSGRAAATIHADRLPLSTALTQMLEPLGLAWRAVDADTLQVTSRKALDARMELEFYPVGGILAHQSPAALMDRLESQLPGATWTEGGGAGVLHFDPPSQCLIVLQSQPVQTAIEALLGEK
jgi:hypothetical protein